jgi:hypothetical protein
MHARLQQHHSSPASPLPKTHTYTVTRDVTRTLLLTDTSSPLQGRCGRRDCPYLHVRLPADAPHCPAFLQGYCSAGVLCPRKHLTPRMLRDAQAAARAAAPAAQQQTVRQQPGGGGGRLSGAAVGGGAHAAAAAVMPAPPTGLRLSGRLSLSRASSDGSASLRGALAALLPSEEEALCVGDSSDSKSDS